MKPSFVAILLSCLAGSAHAAPTDCMRIETDLDRLACYDEQVGRTPAPVNAPQQGKWRMSSQASAFTGNDDVVISTDSRAPVQCRWNSGFVTLTLSCIDNVTKIVLDTGCYMASSQFDDYGHVTYRADEDPAKIVSMAASPDNRSLGLWTGEQAIPVIRDMLGKSKLIVKMTPYSESPLTASFDLAGIDEAIEPLRATCGW